MDSSSQVAVSSRLLCTLAAQQPKSGEDSMTMEEAVKESPREIFLKDYKAPDYAFEKVLFYFWTVLSFSAVFSCFIEPRFTEIYNFFCRLCKRKLL